MMSGLLSLLLPMLLLSSFVCCQDDGDLLLDYDTAVTLAQLPLECYNQVESERVREDFSTLESRFIPFADRTILTSMG